MEPIWSTLFCPITPRVIGQKTVDQTGPKMDPKWCQNVTATIRGGIRSITNVPRRSQNDTNLVHTFLSNNPPSYWTENCGRKWSQNGPEVVPKTHSCLKIDDILWGRVLNSSSRNEQWDKVHCHFESMLMCMHTNLTCTCKLDTRKATRFGKRMIQML